MLVHTVNLFIQEGPQAQAQTIVHAIWRPVHPQFPDLHGDCDSQPQRMSLST